VANYHAAVRRRHQQIVALVAIALSILIIVGMLMWLNHPGGLPD
jgi:flagellar biosynthesis/type III secretory pathway M-ring protein FliF/YscJ